MKNFRWIMMVFVSVWFVMSMSPVAWSSAIWTEEGKKFNAEVDSFSKLYLIGTNGKKSLAKDGTYKTKDGKTIRVKNGVVINGGGKYIKRVPVGYGEYMPKPDGKRLPGDQFKGR